MLKILKAKSEPGRQSPGHHSVRPRVSLVALRERMLHGMKRPTGYWLYVMHTISVKEGKFTCTKGIT